MWLSYLENENAIKKRLLNPLMVPGMPGSFIRTEDSNPGSCWIHLAQSAWIYFASRKQREGTIIAPGFNFGPDCLLVSRYASLLPSVLSHGAGPRSQKTTFPRPALWFEDLHYCSGCSKRQSPWQIADSRFCQWLLRALLQITHVGTAGTSVEVPCISI